MNTLATRFWAKVEKIAGASGCWIWMGALNADDAHGYGVIGLGQGRRGMVYAHRVSWQIHHDAEIPRGTCVLHACDVRCCVNPDHLFLGTHAENVADAVAKGRHSAGARHCAAGAGPPKLTEAKVVTIRNEHSRGASLRELADYYGVTQSAIGLIVARKRWRHVA